MPLRLDVKKKLSQRSDRVKCVDIHPTEPWVLAALYSGHAVIWNYSTGSSVRSFEVTELPIRAAKFIPRKNLVVLGSDDMFIRAYNYNTTERVTEIPEAHTDYIRSLEIHPTQSIMLSASDDMTIKMWDWDKATGAGGAWANTMVFEGHAHYVMMVKFNPKDLTTFASASLDRSVKVWGLSSPTPNFSLEDHVRGVNCVDYYPGGDKPYLISGADDATLKIWDYQTKAVVSTLEGHSNNVSTVAFHPRLPVIISGSEDGTVRIWHNTTYRLETTLNYGMERVWTLAVSNQSNKVAIGYDEGTILIKLGHEMPVASMDKNGKMIIAVNNVISTSSVRNLASSSESKLEDGERLPLALKELGNVELFPQSVTHNSNGRFVAVCGDNEYVIYTAQALRNKAYGSGLDFVWSPFGSGDYAVRESSSKITVFKNFKEHRSFRPPFSATGLSTGALLAVRSNDAVVFYDWESGQLIRRIDEPAKAVHWNDSGELCALAGEDSFYILKFDRDAVAAAAHATGEEAAAIAEDGIESAFDLEHEVAEKLRSGQWVGDCLVYVNGQNKLNYCVGGEVITLGHLDRRMYMLGYLPRDSRVFLMDKGAHVTSFTVPMSILEYQTAVVRRDFDAANAILPDIPEDQYNNIARFLESQGLKEEALAVATDPDIKFELALQLSQLQVAFEIMRDLMDKEAADTSTKWKQLSDLALASSNLPLAEECAIAAGDLGALLLIYTARGDGEGIARLADMASGQGRGNVAFVSHLLLGDVEKCIDVLTEADRLPEAAFMARTYRPSHVPRLVKLWKENLAAVSTRAADSLADPDTYPNMFTDLDWALKAEELVKSNQSKAVPAAAYTAAKADLELNIIEILKSVPDVDDEDELEEVEAEGEEGKSIEPPTEDPPTDEEVEAQAPASPAPSASPVAAAAAAASSPSPSPTKSAASPAASPVKAASPAAAAGATSPQAAAAASSPAAAEDTTDDLDADLLGLGVELGDDAAAATDAGAADLDTDALLADLDLDTADVPDAVPADAPEPPKKD